MVHISVLLVLGLCFMLAHHFFYAHLNEKSIDSETNELPPFLQDQNNANFIGTAIAHGARIAFAMAIGLTFAQLFWEVLRSRSHAIAQIDALVNCGQSPYQPSALRAATTSVALFVISVIAAATSLVVVLSPGALTVSSGFERTSPCTVPSIPSAVMSSDHIFDAKDGGFPTESLMMALLSSNSYIPPYQGNRAAICGNNPSCSYNLTFFGPALDCIDITNQTNFTGSNFDSQPSHGLTQIWEADPFQRGYGVNITINDLVKGALQAITCTAYNATYDVTLEGTPPSVRVRNVTMDTILPSINPEPFINSYTGVALSSLQGTILGGANGYTVIGGQGAYTQQVNAFFVTTTDGNHTFSGSAIDFATSFMQNATISLLSGSIYYNLSSDIATNLQDVSTTCSSLVDVYIYNRTRLLSTYGAALGITALIVAFGCRLILRNGREKKLIFSDVIRIALNEEMYGISGKMTDQTRVFLEGTDRLLPVQPVDDGLQNPQVSSSGSKELNDYGRYTPRTSFDNIPLISLLLYSDNTNLFQTPYGRPLQDDAAHTCDCLLHDLTSLLLSLSERESADFLA